MSDKPAFRPALLWQKGLSFGFYLLYNQLAWTYDTVSSVVSMGQWQAWQRAALPHIRGPRVLELGHGPGHTLIDLHASGYRVVGLDISRAMGRLARRRGRRVGVALSLVRGQAQALPFRSASFETVLSLFPTPYVVDPVTLAAVRRVLVPGGRLVIVPEARLAPTSAPNRALEQLYRLTGQRPATRPLAGDSEQPEDARTMFWTQAISAAPGWPIEQIQVERLSLSDSEVTLIIAER